ncbi:hypothetical protein Acr_11g0012240 [Actinidia rufa]|uniref:Uncharacterized protein n=1 Tax=Actinidia rufa TaxID=165716 RepID=A0A7J0FE22_9ERIC|nr:hypothetical protein Acr_11g0012240 [Actinidia rufa]
MSPYHPAWVIVKPSVVYPDPLEYSPIFIPGFNEEEYASRHAKEDEDGNGGTEVASADAEKEPKAKLEATRASGDLQYNPPSREVPCCIDISSPCLSSWTYSLTLALGYLKLSLGHLKLGAQAYKDRISI